MRSMKFYGGPKDGLEWAFDSTKRLVPPKRVRFQYEDEGDHYVYANRPDSGEALNYYFKGVEKNGNESSPS